MTRYDTIRDADDEPTINEDGMPDLRAPTYDPAPPTLEMRPSPFHPKTTQPGMPPVVTFEAPRITTAPVEDLAGPTVPEGYPLTASGEGPTDPELGPSPWHDAGPADPGSTVPRPPAPAVPPPGAPNILVSQSLMLESAMAEEARRSSAPAPATKPKPRPLGPPTEVLPSLKKKEVKEGSDWPLMLGLLALALMIAGLVGALAYGVVRVVNQAPPPRPAEQAAPTE